MRNRVSLLIILIAAILCGCQSSQVDRQLDRAESIMEEHPDSALTILQQLDGSTLRGEPQARHALLLSQAYDRNNIYETNDSLISIAVSYYQHSGDKYHKMLAHHYCAAVHLYSERYVPALEHTLVAYDIASELKDTLNLSRITSQIAILYSMNYDEAEALKWHCLSLELAKKCPGKEDWIKNSYENIGEQLITLGKNREAIQYADSAISLSCDQNPRAQEIKYMSYFNLGEIQKSDSIFEILSGLDYEMSSDIKRAQALNTIKSQQEIIDYYSEIIAELNNLISDMSQDNLTAVIQRHEAAKTQQLDVKLQNSRQWLTISAIGTLVLIILVILLIRNYRLREKKNIAEKENQILVLIAESEALKETHSRDQDYIQDLNSDINQLKRRASMAFLNQFTWVEHIGNICIEAELTGKVTNSRLIDQFRKQLQLNSPQGLINEIEQIIANNNSDLLAEMNQLGLKDIEKAVVYLSIIKVSTRVISLLTNKSTSAVYNIKSRARIKLRSADSPILRSLLTDL